MAAIGEQFRARDLAPFALAESSASLTRHGNSEAHIVRLSVSADCSTKRSASSLFGSKQGGRVKQQTMFLADSSMEANHRLGWFNSIESTFGRRKVVFCEANRCARWTSSPLPPGRSAREDQHYKRASLGAGLSANSACELASNWLVRTSRTSRNGLLALLVVALLAPLACHYDGE